MIPRETFVNKIRSLNYTYKTQTKRVQLWKKTGGSHRMFVPICDFLEIEFVRSSLRQTEMMKTEEIEKFIVQYNNTKSAT
jgi:hypothetical protein